HGTKGGVAAGTLFVLPGLLCLMALSMLYAGLGQLGPVAALFFGLKAAVLAIVLQAVRRLAARALPNPSLRAIAAAAFLAIFVLAIPFPLIILAAGLLGALATRLGSSQFLLRGHPSRPGLSDADSLLGTARPDTSTRRAALVCLLLWLLPVVTLVATLGPHAPFSQIALFFSEMAVVTFGGAYAVLAYVAQQAVETHHWLRPGEMLDGLGMAETTPGPLIIVTQFVGFMAAYRDPGRLEPMLAGALGGLLTTWVTFTPCFTWIFLGAPFIERLRGNQPLAGALAAITAAVVGVILNLAVWFALHTWFRETTPVRQALFAFDAPLLASLDPWALALSAAALVAVLRFQAGLAPTLLACAAAGLVRHAAGFR
ncbi:MAG: chromate transporter, partial [Pseudomonadota bacterium]|nr:chromate transporter [Pseudomonadota bacterium]